MSGDSTHKRLAMTTKTKYSNPRDPEPFTRHFRVYECILCNQDLCKPELILDADWNLTLTYNRDSMQELGLERRHAVRRTKGVKLVDVYCRTCNDVVGNLMPTYVPVPKYPFI